MKSTLFSFCLLVTTTVCWAQAPKSSDKVRPDLNGTWVLDETRSNLGKEISDYVLTIVHREPEIRMTKRFKRKKKEVKEETVYYTDGRPEPDPRLRPHDPLPETRWRGAKLARTLVTRPVGIGSLDFQILTYEEWTISPDGQMLTRVIESTMGSALIMKTRAVFRRLQ